MASLPLLAFHHATLATASFRHAALSATAGFHALTTTESFHREAFATAAAAGTFVELLIELTLEDIIIELTSLAWSSESGLCQIQLSWIKCIIVIPRRRN